MKQFLSFIIFGCILLCQNSIAAYSQSQAPEIILPGIDGEVILENYKGKVVYIDFWASWCKPCAKSFPWLRDIKQRYADKGFEVLAINLDKERKQADEFLSKMDVNFIVAFDEEGKSAADYKLKGMPCSYLIGRDGKVYASHIGFREKDKDELEQAITQLLNQ